MWVFSLCVCLCTIGQKRTSNSPGTDVTDYCKPLCGCWTWKIGPLEEQPTLLPAEPSLPALTVSPTEPAIYRPHLPLPWMASSATQASVSHLPCSHFPATFHGLLCSQKTPDAEPLSPSTFLVWIFLICHSLASKLSSQAITCPNSCPQTMMAVWLVRFETFL